MERTQSGGCNALSARGSFVARGRGARLLCSRHYEILWDLLRSNEINASGISSRTRRYLMGSDEIR